VPLSHVTNLGSGVHLGRGINLGEQPLMTGALAPAAASTARPWWAWRWATGSTPDTACWSPGRPAGSSR